MPKVIEETVGGHLAADCVVLHTGEQAVLIKQTTHDKEHCIETFLTPDDARSMAKALLTLAELAENESGVN